MSNSLRPHGLYSPWDSPGQNTGMGSCSLLQGIFPTQGSNPGLLQCRWILYQLSHQGSPYIGYYIYEASQVALEVKKVRVLATQSCPTLCNPVNCSAQRSSVHGDSPGKNPRMGSHALLQGIFPTQGLKPGLPHCQWILDHLSHNQS